MMLLQGIMVFEEQALIVTGHQNGELHVFVQPRTEVMVPPGSESTHASSLGTFRPRKITIRVCVCCLVFCCMLSSCGPNPTAGFGMLDATFTDRSLGGLCSSNCMKWQALSRASSIGAEKYAVRGGTHLALPDLRWSASALPTTRRHTRAS
jgi:hypothetical protein